MSDQTAADDDNGAAPLPAVSDSSALPYPFLDARKRIVFECACGAVLNAFRYSAGRPVTCPACGQGVAVPILPSDLASSRPPPLPEPAVAEETGEETRARSDERLLDEIFAAWQQSESSAKKSWGNNLGTLAFTVFLFMALGVFRWSVSGVLLLVVVLLVHETGHYIGMRLLRFRDVRMFFIPLFGAAVTGRETAPTAGRKTIVALMGPALGLAAGIAAGVASLVWEQPLWAEAARLFFLLNLFNLLPFPPLDGGQVFDALVFSRHPRIEAAFKILAALALGGIAYLFRDAILGVFAFLALVTVRPAYVTAVVGRELARVPLADEESRQETMSRERLRLFVDLLKRRIPPAHWNAKTIATYAAGAWQRMRNRACSWAATAGLLVVYGACFLLGLVALFGFEIAWHVRAESPENEQSAPHSRTEAAERSEWAP